MQRYYIDKSMVEHRCCWDAAIARKCPKGQGNYGSDVRLICECDDVNARFICDALNLKAETDGDSMIHHTAQEGETT